MGLTPDVWEKIRSGDFAGIDATLIEVICSVGRQLAYRLEKLIDVLERGPEPDVTVTPTITGLAATPEERLVALMRLAVASYPKDHRVVVVTNAGVLLATNPLPYSIPILVTNLDNAQLLFWGTTISTVLNSPIIDPESSEKITLSPYSDLFGTVIGAAINVAVSNLDLPTV